MPMMVLRRLDILPEPTTPVQKGKVKMAKVKGEQRDLPTAIFT